MHSRDEVVRGAGRENASRAWAAWGVTRTTGGTLGDDAGLVPENLSGRGFTTPG